MNRETWFNNDIPQGWEVTRLKNVIISVKNGIWGDEPLNNSDDIECVRIADFDRKKNIVKDKEFTLRNIPKIQSENYLLKKGDLLIEKSGGGEKQPVGFVVQYNLDKKAVYANFMAKIELNSQKVDSTFINYVFSSLYAVKANLKAFNQTTGIQNLNTSVYLNEVFMYPSLNVQKNIVNFLNKKIQAIDETINKKQKMVELLEQQRQSIITEAVTKGLNPNVKMKDSGVEWIGEIPEHWEVKKVKHFAIHVGSGKTPSGGSEVYLDEGVPFLRSLNVHFDGIRLKDLAFISEETNAEMKSSQVKPLDILLNITGASIGRTAIVPKDFGRANVNQHVCIIRLNQKKIYPYYFNMLMSSDVINQQIWFLQNGSSREGLNFVQVKELTFAVPPTLNEQYEINDWTFNKQKAIFGVISTIKEQIDKLKEYRQSLIYEAVTGKIDDVIWNLIK